MRQFSIVQQPIVISKTKREAFYIIHIPRFICNRNGGIDKNFGS